MIKPKIAIIGVGYVGVNLAVRLPKFFETIAFDINKKKISSLEKGEDPSLQFSNSEILNSECKFTSSTKDLADQDYYLITVPTPVDGNMQPDLSFIDRAVEVIKPYLNSGATIVVESTVLPGTTEKILKKLNRSDLFVCFSPERVSPNDKTIKFEDTVKVVACNSENKLDDLTSIYKKVFKEVIGTTDIKAAELAKLLENTSRDISIAMMNEFYQGAMEKGIDFNEAIRLAKTKWNFPRVSYGLVGGHCISVDPYYLNEFFGNKKDSLVSRAREVNNSMVDALVKRILVLTNPGDHILIAGLTYKKDCNDFRNSKALEVYQSLLKDGSRKVSAYDPYFDDSCDLAVLDKIDLFVNLVAHAEVASFSVDDYQRLIKPNGAILDFAQVVSNEVEKRFKTYY